MESGPVTPTGVEDVASAPPASGDETVLTEDELRRMPLEGMLALCKENDIEITSDLIMGGKPAIFKHLMDTFGI